MLYLPWLEEDGELSQKVADAWNALAVKPAKLAQGGKKTAIAEFAAATGVPAEMMALVDQMDAALKTSGVLGDDARGEDCCIA